MKKMMESLKTSTTRDPYFKQNGELVKSLHEKKELVIKLKSEIEELEKIIGHRQRFVFSDGSKIIIGKTMLDEMFRKDKWSNKPLNKIIAKLNDDDEIELHISMKEE